MLIPSETKVALRRTGIDLQCHFWSFLYITPLCEHASFAVTAKKGETRRFSNHVSRLLSRSHTFAIIVILDLKIHQSMWIHWPFSKNLNQRSLTPRWPLTPCLLRSHVWLYPRIIVSKSHDNTSLYVDTVINFAKYHIHTHTYYILHTYIHILHTEWVIT